MVDDLIDETNQRLSKYRDLPEKPLTSRGNDDNLNYYEKECHDGKSVLNPIGKADSKLVTAYKRRRFLQVKLSVLKDNKNALVKFISMYKDYSTIAIQKRMPKVYRDNVIMHYEEELAKNPAAVYRHLPDSIYKDPRFQELLDWAAEDYPRNTYPLSDNPNITRDGTPLRSKGECMWYDNILFECLPARVEPILEIQGKSGQWHKLHPDFMFKCFDGTIILVEHFGKWDDEKYAERNKRKIQEYLDCGFVIGDNLVITSDNAEHCTNELIIIEALEKIKRRIFM